MIYQTSMLEKSENAYRTIGEVAQILEVEQHILRFWEGKFSHINPKKKQGRRYYNADEVKELAKIKDLLHNQGYTIKGVQQLLANNSEKNITPNIDATIKNNLEKLLHNLENIEQKIAKL
jgi:DNA-binding transcriptional MerR regulator